MARDYYDLLGVSRNANQDEIKEAFRKLAMKFHPDRNKDPSAESKFKEINEAYAVLSDQDKRAQYNTFGPEQFNQRFTEEDIFRGFDFERVFRDLGFNFNFGPMGFGSSDDLFSGLFTRGNQEAQQTGVNLYLSFEDLEKGVSKEFDVQYYKACQNCNGSGAEPGTKQLRCDKCNGVGQLRSTRRTPFGIMQTITACNKCGGAGKINEKTCKTCRGNGRVLVTEQFRIKAERSDKDNAQDKKKRFW